MRRFDAITTKKRVITLRIMIELRNGFWAVEVPEGAQILRVGKSIRTKNTLYFDVPYAAIERQSIDLPSGTWEIVCTSKEATEEQAAQIVERDGKGYKDYAAGPPDNDFGDFVLACDSLNSLLATKGCDLKQNWLILKKR